MIAQEFIDTGPFTSCHRVTTIFARPVWATTSRWVSPRAFDLDPDSAEPFEQRIAANDGERTVTLNFETDIIAFGAEVARAFPEVPSLGIDIVRPARSGVLYAIELNAGGETWHLSSELGIKMQRERGFDLYTQFGALDIVADALIDVTRRDAD